MLTEEIIKLVDLSDGWGKACNQIQDAASETMTVLQWNAFALRQDKDMQECDGSDYIIFNGQMFDWKVFEPKKVEIVKAYLSYFSEPQLVKILAHLQKKGGK